MTWAGHQESLAIGPKARLNSLDQRVSLFLPSAVGEVEALETGVTPMWSGVPGLV